MKQALGAGAEAHAAASACLALAGQRYTANRAAVVDALIGSGGPLTATELVSSVRLAQSSAYRSLSALELAGIVRRVAGHEGTARFELAEPLMGHHHHLVCRECGSVLDYELTAELEKRLEEAAEDAGRRTGFRPVAHSLELVGRCAACAAGKVEADR
ncbi:MAG: Fur family transcriptional regulator [Acidimicrobiales bacterium]